MPLRHMLLTGALGAELTESQAALRVFLAAGGLVLLGLVLLLLTVWWWRGTKPESPALGPLEVMSDRKWMTAAESERRRLLETHRPDGAEPANLYVAPVPVDLSVLARDVPSSFDDLRDPFDLAEPAPLDPEAAELAGSPDDGEPDENQRIDDEPNGEASGAARGSDGESEAALAPVEQVPTGEPMRAPEPLADEEPDSDATVAISRDETVAMRSPEQPVSPHGGA